MPRRSFVFAAFTPAVWRDQTTGVAAPDDTIPSGLDPTDVPGNPSGVTISQLAPQDVEREELSTIFTEAVTGHAAFRSYSVRHDFIKSLMEYVAGTDGNPSPNETMELRIAQPLDFYLHEFGNASGQAYVGASEAVVRQVFRRAVETHGPGVELHIRNVNLENLEVALGNTNALRVAEIIGYKLLRVRSDTPLKKFDVLGQDISNNREVQDAKSRADSVKAFAVRLLYANSAIEVWISESGGVSFLHYPGDTPALGLLAILHPLIEGCSALKAVRGSVQ